MVSANKRASDIVQRLNLIQGKPPGIHKYPEELRSQANCFLFALAIRPREWGNLHKEQVSTFLQVPIFAPIVNAVTKARALTQRNQITEYSNIMPITEGVINEVVRMGALRLTPNEQKTLNTTMKVLPLIIRPNEVINGVYVRPGVTSAPKCFPLDDYFLRKLKFYRIAVYASERDFHFAREYSTNNQKGWAHKPGQTEMKRTDSNDKVIANPSSATMSVGNVRYRYVGQLYVIDHKTRDDMQKQLKFNPLVKAITDATNPPKRGKLTTFGKLLRWARDSTTKR